MQEDKREGRESAFPGKVWTGYRNDEPTFDHPRGLTKREYFAGLVLAAMNANAAFNQNTANERAKFAVVGADALLAALSRPQP
jgi:hypothetical protein